MIQIKNINSRFLLISLVLQNLLTSSPIKSNGLSNIQKSNLCMDYIGLALGGYERCFREIDSFWRELNRNNKEPYTEPLQLTEEEYKRRKKNLEIIQKYEEKRKRKEILYKKARQERRQFKNGNYHRFPIKPSILALSRDQQKDFCRLKSNTFNSSLPAEDVKLIQKSKNLNCLKRLNGFDKKNGVFKKELVKSYLFSDHTGWGHQGSRTSDKEKMKRNYEVKTGDKVRIHYVGTLEDGTIFENSYLRTNKRKGAISFKLGSNREIEGWNIGIPGMRLGGIRELIIPPELGYGSKGKGKIVPPNSTLYYVLELTKIEGKNIEKYLEEKY